MPQLSVIGISGNISRPSRTKLFVDHIATTAAHALGASSAVHDITDFGPSLPQARRLADIDPSARNLVEQATAPHTSNPKAPTAAAATREPISG